MKKEDFIFHLEYREQIDMLSTEQKGELLDALCDYAQTGEVQVELDPLTKMCFSIMRQRMDRDTENYEKKCERLRANGAKGGRPSKTEEEKPNGFSENQMVSDENQENQIDVVPDPDPVPDPDKDKRQTHRDRAQTRKADPIDYQSIFDAYNSICTSMPPVETFSESRKKAIRSMLRTRSPDEVKQLFARAQASPFLTGTNDTGWRASFDWIMNQSNAAKILEGNYDRRNPRPKATQFTNYSHEQVDWDAISRQVRERERLKEKEDAGSG